MFLEKALSFSEKGCSLFEETSYAFSENIGRLFLFFYFFRNGMNCMKRSVLVFDYYIQ